MNETHVKAMKAAACVVLAAAAVAYVYHFARSVDRTYAPRTFSVDGTAKVESIPDVAQFSVTVISEGGMNVAEIQQSGTEKMQAINTYLKEQGVKEKDLKTTVYNLSPRYNSPTCTPTGCAAPKISGYILNQTLAVKVRDTAVLGALLSGVVEKGANTVSDVQFVVDDEEDAKSEARDEAMAKAKSKAKEVARAGGFRLGRVITVYESDESVPPMSPMSYEGMGMGGDMGAKSMAAAPIEVGTQSNELTVTVTYEIE